MRPWLQRDGVATAMTPERDPIIDDVDRTLNPIGRFYRHNAMHAGRTPMVLDELGRGARCVLLGFGNRTPSAGA